MKIVERSGFPQTLDVHRSEDRFISFSEPPWSQSTLFDDPFAGPFSDREKRSDPSRRSSRGPV